MSQTRVSHLAGVLLAVLNRVLDQRGLLPARDGAQLAQRLAAHPTKVFAYDGVERGILRNADPDGQKEEYSAKKSPSPKKTTPCATIRSSCTTAHRPNPGGSTIKKIADEYPLHLPVGSVLRQDLGLLGHRQTGVVVEMPHKKPPKRELTFSQKLYNQLLSPLRVVIEHVHRGIKRLRMVKDPLRIRSEWFCDTVLVVACGLHNLRVRSPHRVYLACERAKLANYCA